MILLRLAFLGSARRAPILDTGTLARVHVFRNRLPMMHRAGWTGPRASSATAFAWLVWDREHHGPATINASAGWQWAPSGPIPGLRIRITGRIPPAPTFRPRFQELPALCLLGRGRSRSHTSSKRSMASWTSLSEGERATGVRSYQGG